MFPVVDTAFNPSTGGYRAGGSVSWGDPLNPINPFVFDTSAFASITSIKLDVLVVGFLYNGKITLPGELGNYLAIDSTPFAPFVGVTDHRDMNSFDLTSVLLPGSHFFRVTAFSYEGWAGVDIATLTVTGDNGVNPVPLPPALALFAGGLSALGLLGWRRKRKAAAVAAA